MTCNGRLVLEGRDEEVICKISNAMRHSLEQYDTYYFLNGRVHKLYLSTWPCLYPCLPQVINLIFEVSLIFIYASLFLIELIFANIFNSCLVSYFKIEKSIIWINLYKWKKFHVTLEIGWHKSFGLESNLIREFTKLVMQF